MAVNAIELSDHHDIVNAFAMHYSIISVKAELDQMVQGLEAYGVYKLIQGNRQLMRQLFVHFKPLTFTADKLFDMFPAKFSPEGSIARDAEEAALMNWVNYTQEIEGNFIGIPAFTAYLQAYFHNINVYTIFVDCQGTLKVVDPDGKEEQHHITLESIVVFATGMPDEPPLGFSPKSALLFQKDTIFPFANTCANQLYIPVEKMTFVEFKYNMTYGFLNSTGFGQI